MSDPDPSETKPGRAPNPKIGRGMATALTAFLLLAAVSAGLFTAYAIRTLNQPADVSGPETTVVIKPGDTLLTISETLQVNRLITSSRLFRLLARYHGMSKRLQAGEYLLSPAMTPREILNLLSSGKVRLHRLTVPEGLTFRETATLVEQSGFGSRNNFIRLCTDRTFLKSLGIDQDSTEGYLFPETYFFPKTISEEEIIRTMVDRFNTVFRVAWRQQALELGLTVNQVVTLASIIEKETGDASERPLISSVFHNRLKQGMRLESDPTVIYGIPDFNGNITRKNLMEFTPYNTYRIQGLPPGPIANPGKSSLDAALYPPETDFLFFVSKQDTTHYFSRTRLEHEQAVRKYQLKK
ncbi:MAG: endolytic transglycosylase MltG [Pseudomonadota bacterium]